MGQTTARLLTITLGSSFYFVDPNQLQIPLLGPKDKDKSLHPNFALGILHEYRTNPDRNPGQNDRISASDLAQIINAINAVICADTEFQPLFRQVEHEQLKLHGLLREVRNKRGFMRAVGIFLQLLPDEWETTDAEAAEVYRLWREGDKGEGPSSRELNYGRRANNILASQQILAKQRVNRELLDLYLRLTGGFETDPPRVEHLRYLRRDIYGEPLNNELELSGKVKGD